MMSNDDVLISRDHGAVRVLSLNRPDRLNALNTDLTQAIHDALIAADRDDRIRAIVLAGEGRAFCSGADLSEFKDLTPEHAQRVMLRADLTSRTQILPQQLTKPVVSAVQGAAVGGGAGLALAADMAIAADNLKFGYPEIKHSIVPALVMTGLQRHLGRKLAFEMISTGRLLDAGEAFEAGLVNRIVPAGEERDAAFEVAATWATYHPSAIRAIKELFYRVADLPVTEAMQAGREVNMLMRGFREHA